MSAYQASKLFTAAPAGGITWPESHDAVGTFIELCASVTSIRSPFMWSGMEMLCEETEARLRGLGWRRSGRRLRLVYVVWDEDALGGDWGLCCLLLFGRRWQEFIPYIAEDGYLHDRLRLSRLCQKYEYVIKRRWPSNELSEATPQLGSPVNFARQQGILWYILPNNDAFSL